ncbi:MAG: DUF4422 domain-containing protein [Cetobacterium sp.]
MKIIVATHKKYKIPSIEGYKGIQIGNNKEEFGYLRDNTGNNIADKNSSYCELTALYWVWKNMNYEILGLCHYRRYFVNKSAAIIKLLNKDLNKYILDEKDCTKILNNYDIILPEKSEISETIYEEYCRGHYEKDLIETKKIIQEIYPQHLKDFEFIMNEKSIYYNNMFVAKKEDINEYFEWLFKILFELEKRIDISNYDSYQARIFGFISERLFNVWIKSKNFKIKELKVINIEDKFHLRKSLKKSLKYKFNNYKKIFFKKI